MRYLTLFLLLLVMEGSIRAQQPQLMPRGRTPDASVEILHVNRNRLYVGGDFSKVGYFVGGVGFLPNGGTTPNLNFPGSHSAFFAYDNGNVQAVAQDGMGGYYLGGSFSRLSGQAFDNLGHVLPNREVNLNFPHSTNGEVRTMAIFNDTMMVAGNFTEVNGNPQPYFFAFHNLTFTPIPVDLQLDGPINKMLVRGDTLILGGNFTRILGVNQQGIARLRLSDFSLIETPSTTSGQVTDLSIAGNTLYAGGSFLGEAGRYAGHLGQFFNNTPTNNASFPAASGDVEVVVPDGSGGWYVGGSFFNVGGNSLARLAHILPNQTVDPAFSFSINGTVQALMIFNDTMMIGGSFTQINGQPRSRLAAIDLGTQALLNWAPDPDNQVYDLAMDADHLYVAGSFDQIAGDYQPGLAVFDRSTLQSLPAPSPPNGQVNTLIFNDTLMYAGGTFTQQVGNFTGKLALFQGSSAEPDLDKLNVEGDVNAIIPDGSGGWYVGGSFFRVNGDASFRRLVHVLPNGQPDPAFAFNFNGAVHDLLIFNDTMMVVGNFTTIDGQARGRMAAIDVNTQTLLPFNPDFNNSINDIAIFNDTIMVVGNFTTVNGQPRGRGASLTFPTGTLLNWDPDANSNLWSLVPFGNQVVIGGQFTSLGGNSYGRLALVDKINGTPTGWNPNLNNTAYTLAVDGNTLYVGGAFTLVDGVSRNRLASFDLSTQTLGTFNPDADNWVQTIFLEQDTLFVGGRFTNLGGQPHAYVAKIDKQSGAPGAWDPQLDDYVYAIYSETNQTLLGGRFDVAGARPRSRFFALNPTTLEVAAWAPEANGTVEDMAIFNDTMMVVGAFTQINGQPRQRIAKVDLAAGAALPWTGEADNVVYSVAIRGDSVVVGGRFDQINGLPYPNLAAFDGQTGQLLPWQPEPGDDVNDIAVQGNQVLVGGSFSTFETKNRNRALAIDLGSGQLTDWDPRPAGSFFGSVQSVFATPDEVYLGGSFGTVGDSTRPNFAAVDALTGAPLSWTVELDGRVNGIQVFNDTLMLVGDFEQANGLPRQHAAGIDLNLHTLTDWNPRPNNPPSRLQIFNDTIMVLGNYGYLDARERRYVYSVDLRTDSITRFAPEVVGNLYDLLPTPEGDKVWIASWSSSGDKQLYAVEPILGDSLPGFAHRTDEQILKMAYHTFNRTLYFAGEFTEVDGQPRTHLAAIDSLGNLTDFSVDIDGDVLGLDVRDTFVYFVGQFNLVNGETRDGMAAVNLAGELLDWAPEPFNGFASGVIAKRDRILVHGSFSGINDSTRRQVAALHPITGEVYDWNPDLSNTGTGGIGVQALHPTNNGVLIGGSFAFSAGTFTPALTYNSERSGRQLIKLPQVYERVEAMATHQSSLYVAQPQATIDGKLYPYLSRVSFSQLPFNARVRALTPNQGGNTGDVTLKINGRGFTQDTRVTLVAPGLPPIAGVDSATLIYGGEYLETMLVLRGQPAGVRDVVIEIPGDTTFVLPNAFTVLDGGEARPYADVFFPGRITRGGRPFDIFVYYGNHGNIDAHGVPLWIGLTEGLEVEDLGISERIFIDTTQTWVDSLSGFFPVDTIGRRPFKGKAIAYILPRIGAGESRMIRLKVRRDSLGRFRAVAWATDGIYGSPLKAFTGECMAAILEFVLGVVPATGCVYGLFQAVTCPMYSAATDPDYGTTQDAVNWAIATGATVTGCLGNLFTGGTASVFVFLLQEAATLQAAMEITNCFPVEDKDPQEGETLNSRDPNDKTGPGGQGGLHWITTNRVMPYLIRFENDTSAGLPAQIVIIRDTLDRNVYDLKTLKLMSFSIGLKSFNFPINTKQHMMVVDLLPDLDALVRVETDLDTLTGELVCTFTTLDRLTFEPTQDPLAGFLPPNDDGVSGTGDLAFLIDLKESVTTGTEIGNRAAIYFDTNAPIITNRWTNIADDDAPMSAVEPLPDTMRTATFQVHWSGSDLGAGIRDYQLYFSENGGPYQVGSLATSDTFATFTGQPGSSYAFYTIAVDTALNEELPPITADATTYIGEGASGLFDEIGVANTAVQVFPNPNQGSFYLAVKASRTGVLRYRIVDQVGRELMRETQNLGVGEHRLPVRLSEAKGIYLLEYEFNGLQGSERLIVN